MLFTHQQTTTKIRQIEGITVHTHANSPTAHKSVLSISFDVQPPQRVRPPFTPTPIKACVLDAVHLHRSTAPTTPTTTTTSAIIAIAMSNNNQFIQRTSASLFEDDDIDDATFLANSSNHNGGPAVAATNAAAAATAADQRLEQLRAQKEAIEQRTLASTQRSLGLLHETEHVGTATAEELAKQREQLENTNKQLSVIDTTLRSSQKHINGLKSVFGGLRNYLSGQKGAANGVPTTAGAGSPRVLSPNAATAAAVPADTTYEAHPVARLRGDGPQQQQQLPPKSSYSEQLDENLDLMAGSLSRLKGLAMDLNQDIESQNDLIDDIAYKVEDVDMKIQRQNRDVNKMLKK